MKKLIAIAAAMLAFAAVASANNYVANDAAIDAIVSEAVMEAPAPAAAPVPPALNGDPAVTNVVALVVDWIGLGGIGIHRLILGTKPINCLWYFLTLGGIFGIVPLIDGIMLIVDLINGSASYFDNPAFIMWL